MTVPLPPLTVPDCVHRRTDTLRFNEGEYAVLASPRAQHSQPWAGCTVRITYREVVQGDERLLARNVGVPSPVDYVITYPDGSLGGVDDWQLRPETPEETTRRWGIAR